MAITLYDAGVDVKSAQKFLGHSDIQVTLKIYTHLSEGKEQAAVDALNMTPEIIEQKFAFPNFCSIISVSTIFRKDITGCFLTDMPLAVFRGLRCLPH